MHLAHLLLTNQFINKAITVLHHCSKQHKILSISYYFILYFSVNKCIIYTYHRGTPKGGRAAGLENYPPTPKTKMYKKRFFRYDIKSFM